MQNGTECRMVRNAERYGMQNGTGGRGYDEVLVLVRRGLGPVCRRFRAIIFFWCFALG